MDMENLMKEFLEDFSYFNTKKQYIEIIDEEITQREIDNCHSYIIFSDLTLETVKQFKKFFIDNYKRTKNKTTKQRYLP